MPDKKLHRRLDNLFADRRPVAQDIPPSPAAAPSTELPAASAPIPVEAAPRLLGWTWEADEGGRYTFCSPEVTTVLGYAPEEILGQALTNLLVEDSPQGAKGSGVGEWILEAIRQARPLTDLRLAARRRDGQSVYLVTHARPLFDEAGRLSGYQGVTHLAAPAAIPGEPSPDETPPVQAVTPGEAPAEALPARPEAEVPAVEEISPLSAIVAQPVETPPSATQPDLRMTAAEWRVFLEKQGGQSWGYLDTVRGLAHLGDFTTSEMNMAVDHGGMVFYDAQSASFALDPAARHAGRAMAIPIQLQDQTIGVLDFFDESSGTWSEDDLALVQAVADQLALALENARLFNATRDQLTKRTLLYEVTRAAASAADLQEALQSAVEALARVLPDANLAILLLEADHRTLRIRASVGFSPDMANTLMTRVGAGVVGRVAQTNQAILIPDVRQHPDDLVWKSNTLSELAVPLALGDRVIGVLNVESPRVNAFDEADLQLLSTLAGTLSAIIVNNNLLAQINRERERLALLNDVLAALTQTLDLDTQISTVLSFAPRLGAQHGYLLLLGETEAETIFRSTLPGLDHFTEIEARDFGNTIAIRGLEHWVIANRQPAVVPDTRKDDRWHTDPSHVEEEPARSVISVPLRTQRGALTGVLAFTHPVPGTLTKDQLSLVESISAQVTVAVENARLYEQTRTQRRSAEALARATQAMNRSALDEGQLMQALVDELFEAYRPDSVMVLRWEPASYMLTPDKARFDDEAVSPEAQAVARQSFRATDRPDLLTIIETHQGAIRFLAEKDGPWAESMAFPLIYGSDVEGVVEVVHTSRVGSRGLDQDDLNLFQGIMTALTSALQSARLYAVQRETAERLAEVDRLKSQFLANMSHELRTPLNSIIGFSRVILKGIDGPLTDLQSQDLASIYNSGQHLLGLINDILDLARIEAGKMELVLDELDLHDIIKGVMSTAVGLVKDKPIALHEDTAPDLPTARADSMRVRQVMLNLLSNAAKFTDEGSITLRTRPVQTPGPISGQIEPFVEISVIDTGHGIAPPDMAKLFEPFSQVDASATRKVGGSGLGLNICRQLVELHGGRIWVESDGAPGKGSTFSFTLPVNRPELQDTRSPVEVGSDVETLLSIDDDQGVLNLYRRYLEPHGYKVVGVTKSTEAVARAAEVKPVAILLDVLMSGKDGWQVLSELKQNDQTRDIPVIMCTIASDPKRAFSMGAVDYLAKPILESDLLRALKKLRAQPDANLEGVLQIEHPVQGTARELPHA